MTYSVQTTSGVFADYLDVTMSPDEDRVLLDMADFLLAEGGTVLTSDDRKESITFGSGVVFLENKPSFLRISASGGVLSTLRELGKMEEYLAIMSTYRPKVTRLDCALDVPLDTPKILTSLRRKYPDGLVRLSHKPLKVTEMVSIRPDGKRSGTYYVGHKSRARVTARVYDKALERKERAGVDIPPTTRYELTFKADIGPSFHDVLSPDKLFWAYASPALLRRPKGMQAWESTADKPWSYKKPEVTEYEALKRQVENSADLESMLERADRIGSEGRKVLLRLITKRIESAH